MFNGYHEAKTIDDEIGEVMEAHGITKDTSIEWGTFVRTLKTSLDLIEGALAAMPKVCPQCNGKGEIL